MNKSSLTVHKRVLREYEDQQAIALSNNFKIIRFQTIKCVRIILDVTTINSATILIDVANEIKYSSRHILSSALTQIVQDFLNVVKLFVTSQDDDNLHALFSNAVIIKIQKEYISKDMKKFVRQEISFTIRNRRMFNKIVLDNLKQDLMSVLIAKAKEM